MTFYVPVYTHCSDCGNYSGCHFHGPAFTTERHARLWLSENPNPDAGPGFGQGDDVITIETGSDISGLVGATTTQIEAELWRRGQGRILRPHAERA